MNGLLLITSVLTGGISAFIASIFKIKIGFLIFFFSVVILNLEILSLLKKISGINILILTLVEFLITGFIWIKKGKPVLKVNFKSAFLELKEALLKDKSLVILFIFWLIFILGAFLLAFFCPVNEPDAQSYHALRSLFWVKDGFISHFEVADIRCHCMPINSELFYSWILALSKNDSCIGILEFFSYFLLIITSYKIMEIYEIEPVRRIWGIIIFSSLAGVISQTSSTQTDLTIGALLTSSFYYILKYKKENELKYLFVSALSMGISFGVKSTGIIGSIPLLIYYLITLKKDFIKFFLFLGLNFTIFSLYNYILNFINYGNPLGSNSALIGHGFWGGYKAIIGNFIRYIFQFFDFSGFTIGFYLNTYLQNLQTSVLNFFGIEPNLGVNAALDFTNIGMEEQTIGFGILGFILVLPFSIYGFFNKKLRLFSIIFWAQILTLSFSVAYMIYSIRFIVSFIPFLIPIIGLSYSKKGSIYKGIIVIFAIFYLGYASFFLTQRPLSKILPEFKNYTLSQIQEKIRDLDFPFYISFNKTLGLKRAAMPYCLENKNIGLILPDGYMIYDTKYLELNNTCKINTINLLHQEDFDYDVLIVDDNFIQKLGTINKNDIYYPKAPNYKTSCKFIGLDNDREEVLIEPSKINKAIKAVCKVNENYLYEIGYRKKEHIKISMPEFLKYKKDETVKGLYVLTRE